MALPEKRARFVEEYPVDLNATQAAIRAGLEMKACPPLKGYYTYFLIDSRNGRIFYVGKGKGGRMYQHLTRWLAGTEQNAAKAERISEILADGGGINYAVFSQHGSDEDAAYETERLLIEALQPYGLTNLKPGQLTDRRRGQLLARAALRRIVPFDQYARRHTLSNVDIWLYWTTVFGLKREAGFG